MSSRNSGATSPIGEVAVDNDGFGLDGRDGADALVAADVGDELVVVGVAVAAGHGLDVAAELFVKLIDEGDGAVAR